MVTMLPNLYSPSLFCHNFFFLSFPERNNIKLNGRQFYFNSEIDDSFYFIFQDTLSFNFSMFCSKLVITAVTIKLPNSIVCFQFLLLFVCFHYAVWHWILVPQPGIKVQNPNHLIAHEVLQESVFSFKTENFLPISPLHPTTSLASSCAVPSVYFTQEHRLLS